MKRTIDLGEFRREFKVENIFEFSPDGLLILYRYLRSLEEESGKEIELDAYRFLQEFAEVEFHYFFDVFRVEFATPDEQLKWLEERTTVCGHNEDTVVFCRF
jgi:hypothetical protein